MAEVPFVDVLNTLHDATNPLVFSSFPIWGDPAKPEVFDYIASYSPYENVHAAPYPAVLASAGLLDDRLGYWEAAKWVAALREKTTSGRPILLHTDMAGGHQGADESGGGHPSHRPLPGLRDPGGHQGFGTERSGLSRRAWRLPLRDAAARASSHQTQRPVMDISAMASPSRA